MTELKSLVAQLTVFKKTQDKIKRNLEYLQLADEAIQLELAGLANVYLVLAKS